MQRGDACCMGLELGQLVAVDPAQAGYAVRAAAPLQLLQPRQLAVAGGDDHLAAADCRDAPRVAVLEQLTGAGHAQLGLQRSGHVVHALVDDARVVAGLVGRDRALALEHLKIEVGKPGEQLAGSRQAEDAATDDGEIALAAGSAHPCLSDQSYGMRSENGSSREISSGSCGWLAQFAIIAGEALMPLTPFQTMGGIRTMA